jgi:hypothetical protein
MESFRIMSSCRSLLTVGPRYGNFGWQRRVFVNNLNVL